MGWGVGHRDPNYSYHWRIQRGAEGTFAPLKKTKKIRNKHKKINGEERKQRERERERDKEREIKRERREVQSLRLKLS